MEVVALATDLAPAEKLFLNAVAHRAHLQGISPAALRHPMTITRLMREVLADDVERLNQVQHDPAYRDVVARELAQRVQRVATLDQEAA